ncbi:MAG: HAD family hydrolase [Thermoprotei archaeon]
MSRSKRFSAAAFDLDGTLKVPDEPYVSEAVSSVLSTLRDGGVKLVLVTGRCELEARKIASLELFDRVVAENGALLLSASASRVLASKQWMRQRSRLLQHTVAGCERVIFSFSRQEEPKARSLVSELGLAAEVQPNKDRVMVVPRGVNKAKGLAEALSELGESPSATVCFGDGENDLPMFRLCGYSVALANSVPELKLAANAVATLPNGEGVREQAAKIWRELFT